MPLSPKQRKGLAEARAHCASCGEKVNALRRMGVPNEALEARQQAVQTMIEEAEKVIQEFDTQPKGGK